MSNEIVKYDNKVNLLDFKGLSLIENNLFFAILARLKEKQTREIQINFYEIAKYVDKNLTDKEIAKLLLSSAEKVVKTAIKWNPTPDRTILFTLFEKFEISNNDFILHAQITKTFEDILNNFKQGFTMFELAEFSSLNSKYTQTIYRLLKQFRSTGYLKMDWNDFKTRLDIPKSYNIGTIEYQILKPAIEELTEVNLFNQKVIFNNLIYEKGKTKGKGNKITHITFTFDPEDTDNKKQISEKKQKAKLKAENEKTEFSNQFYGKKFSTNGITFLIYKIYKNKDETITADLENFSKLSYGKTEPYNFENLETLKKLIAEYEKNNPVKDRPGVRKFFK